MARLLLTVMLLGCIALIAVRAADTETAEGQEAPLDVSAEQAGEEQASEEQMGDEEIENPNYEAELARLRVLCKTIKDDLADLFKAKHHHQQEQAIMAHAAALGEHLEQRHEEYQTQHHDEWTCKQARDALAHEKAQKFMNHFENWYNGKDVTPGISHQDSLRLISHLRDELLALRLVNDETEHEFRDIIDDMTHLEKWHLDLSKWYRELMTDADGQSCEAPFKEYMKVLHELHGEKVPEWFHLAEGVSMLLEQCKEDPNLNADL
jgi:hypothetical protein